MTVAREVWRLAIPAIATSLLQTAVFLVDRIMLGHHSPVDLAAIHIAGNVEWSIFSVSTAFTVGTLARVGMATGGRDLRAVRAATVVSLGVATVLGVATAVVLVPSLSLLPAAFPHASPPVAAGASGYLRASFLVAPAMLTGAAATAALQGSGDTRTPLLVGVVVNVVHVALNAALISGRWGAPELGAVGAGISTAACFVLEAALLAVALLRPGGLLRGPAGAPLRPELAATARLAWPAVLERAVLHVGFLAYTGVIGYLGDEAMAGNQALISVESICFLTADGFGVAAAAIVAKKVGAGAPGEARRAAVVATRAAVAVLVAYAAAIVALRDPLLALFTSDPRVASVAHGVVPVLAVAQPFMGFGIVVSQAVRGAGATRGALAVSFVGSVLVRVPACWSLAVTGGLGLFGVWIGSTLDWAVRTVALFALVAVAGDRMLARASARYAEERARAAT